MDRKWYVAKLLKVVYKYVLWVEGGTGEVVSFHYTENIYIKSCTSARL